MFFGHDLGIIWPLLGCTTSAVLIPLLTRPPLPSTASSPPPLPSPVARPRVNLRLLASCCR